MAPLGPGSPGFQGHSSLFREGPGNPPLRAPGTCREELGPGVAGGPGPWPYWLMEQGASPSLLTGEWGQGPCSAHLGSEHAPDPRHSATRWMSARGYVPAGDGPVLAACVVEGAPLDRKGRGLIMSGGGMSSLALQAQGEAPGI